MNVRRGLWRTWVVLTTMWVGVLILTGKYSCPFVFWLHRPWCDYWTKDEYIAALAGMFGLPLATLIVGLIVNWIVAGFSAKKP